MTILIMGGTGTIGSALLNTLAENGIAARAMVRSPEGRSFPQGIEVVKGDMSDVGALRSALQGISTVFLLNAVSPDELHQSLLTLNLAREAGASKIVYLSVMEADRFSNVPHFAAKAAAELAIRQLGFTASILRPNYFMQNDLDALRVIEGYGVYPMVIGPRGVSMVDVRDIVDAAFIELTRLEAAPHDGLITTHNLVGPDILTGTAAAEVWSQEMGRTISYVGDDLKAAEEQMTRSMPLAMAYDLCLMFASFHAHGFCAAESDVAKLSQLLGRPPRSYRDFVQEALRKGGAG